MAWRKDDDGRPTQKPMVVLKKAVEMLVDRRGKIVAVECKEKLGVWVDAFEHALESLQQANLTRTFSTYLYLSWRKHDILGAMFA